MIYLQILLTLFLAVFLYLLIFRYKAPWVPTFKNDIIRLSNLIKLEDSKTFYDLGCGDGRVIFYLAKKNPQVKFVGIEISLLFYCLCNLRRFLGNYKNVKFKLADYMRLDLNSADYVFIFANQQPVIDLAKKINSEVNKPIIVISYCFEIPIWQNYLLLHDKPMQTNSIFIYHFQTQKRG
jgi:SAM-dependent methyltransferase